MIDVSQDIHSLTEFKTKTPTFLEELREVGRALLLTVNGRAEVAVMGAATFQKVLEAVNTLETLRGIRDSLDDVKAGRTRPANEFELRKRFMAKTNPPDEPAEATFVSLRESDRTERDTPSPKDRPLDKVLLDCLAALSASSNGAVRLAEVREEFKRRTDRGELDSESDARVRIALGILDVAKSVGRVRKTGDESGLGVPVSQERWERIFGTKTT